MIGHLLGAANGASVARVLAHLLSVEKKERRSDECEWGSESQPSHSSQKSQSEAVVWKFSTDDRPFPTFLTAHAF